MVQGTTPSGKLYQASQLDVVFLMLLRGLFASGLPDASPLVTLDKPNGMDEKELIETSARRFGVVADGKADVVPLRPSSPVRSEAAASSTPSRMVEFRKGCASADKSRRLFCTSMVMVHNFGKNGEGAGKGGTELAGVEAGCFWLAEVGDTGGSRSEFQTAVHRPGSTSKAATKLGHPSERRARVDWGGNRTL